MRLHDLTVGPTAGRLCYPRQRAGVGPSRGVDGQGPRSHPRLRRSGLRGSRLHRRRGSGCRRAPRHSAGGDQATHRQARLRALAPPLGRGTRFCLDGPFPLAAFDAAFAFYEYEWFHEAGGFAAVPLVAKGRAEIRTFSPQGLPLCAAGLAMPRKFTYTDRTKTIVVHERGRYVCPLVYPQPGASACPINHAKWPSGGCTADMPTCAGARIRYQLDRESAEYKEVFKQRTADERSNSQAVDLGTLVPALQVQVSSAPGCAAARRSSTRTP